LKNEYKVKPYIDVKTKHGHIYDDLLKKYKRIEIMENWPEWSKFYGVIYYYKKKLQGTLPKTIEDIVIADDLAKLKDQTLFLRYDNKCKNKRRIIIFISEEGLEIASVSPQWLIDGTFKSCPNLFYQILTIHGYFKNHHAFPFAYILLQSKDRQTYEDAFKQLRIILKLDNDLTIKLEQVITDFELSLQQAIKSQFKNVELKGCWFHFNQAIVRKLFSLGNAFKIN
jgi:hypothetical protein